MRQKCPSKPRNSNSGTSRGSDGQGERADSSGTGVAKVKALERLSLSNKMPFMGGKGKKSSVLL